MTNDKRSDIPRRADMQRWVPAERGIYDAMQAVEAMPADVRLTAAVTQLGEAFKSVADFVDAAGIAMTDQRPCFVCAACGPRVGVDEDGCCRMCGADAVVWADPPKAAPAVEPPSQPCNDVECHAHWNKVVASLTAEREALKAERDKWLDAFNRSEQFQNGPAKRAEAAEAEVRRLREARELFTTCRQGRPHYCPNCDNSFAFAGNPPLAPTPPEGQP